jgi:hypothetical protein
MNTKAVRKYRRAARAASYNPETVVAENRKIESTLAHRQRGKHRRAALIALKAKP